MRHGGQRPNENGQPDALGLTKLMIADDWMRSAVAHAERGAGATAVLDAQAAMFAYRQEAATVAPLDAARVLTVGGSVLAQYGDPDLASAAAGAAIDLYWENLQEVEASGAGYEHFAYLAMAASVAEAVHTSQGRMDEARMAFEVAEGVVVTSENDESRNSPTAGPVRTWPIAGMPDWARVSFRTALETAEQQGGNPQLARSLRAALVRPDFSDTPGWFTSLDRVLVPHGLRGLDLIPRFANELAESAHRVLGSDPRAALRLVLETHYLLMGAWSLGSPALNNPTDDLVLIWASVLELGILCANACEDPALAADLDKWRGRVSPEADALPSES
jgi:hypothetical protein